ncbi:CPBP family intramembrane glutamic endopeptidase [Dethiobacter alkaliphilus]|uniref:Abortive infection protein n=1 Tax=Dethiobacter alkaliphilus AHT 1 TaxID=555088 RepID=C0GDU3_DETAL|nr:CPBP family intramembrane glutamic endopeptidase [Dethiobacter alkaliphilus]EEG78576.1 Abortive infection protein [Dethiobacter alkaliphilus AHT 1]
MRAPYKIPYSRMRKQFDFKEKALFIIGLTVILIGINILAGLLHLRVLGEPDILKQFNSISEIVAISARAALLEEVVFRFIMITVIMHLLQRVSKFHKMSVSRMWLVSLIISSLAFMFVHSTEAYLIAFAFGMLLGYTFIKHGLIVVIAIHFLVNVSTFTYFFLFH